MASILWSQQPSSITIEYEELENNIKSSTSDSIREVFASNLLLKAKKENNIIKIADGFNHLSEIYSHTLKGLKYADSIIDLTTSLKNERYPSEGYLQKGIQLYYLSKHKEALENYINAFIGFEANNNDFDKLRVNHYIGILKNNIHEEKEALKIFERNILFFENSENKKKYQRQYLKSLFAIVDSYNRNKILDSAEIYGKIGIKESLATEDNYLYNYFLLTYGATKTLKKEYRTAIDSLMKGSELLTNEKRVLAGSYLVLSEAYEGENNYLKSFSYLNRVDSLYQRNPEIIFQAKESYEILLKSYQKEKDAQNQLEIIKKLLKVDSVINVRHNELSKNIVKKYETPLLLSEKERLINDLKGKSSINRKIILSLIVICSVVFLALIYIFSKNRKYKKRFNSIIEKRKDRSVSLLHKDTLLKTTTTTTTTGLPEGLVKEVLQKLDEFEKSHKFIKKNYTLNSLAKNLNTNSAYLSKIINATLKVNFSNYINNLKIDYAINRLTENKQLRSYTIKAIAEEVGFNNAQSFSVAFNKRTGIYPSFFLKQLEKNEKQIK